MLNLTGALVSSASARVCCFILERGVMVRVRLSIWEKVRAEGWGEGEGDYGRWGDGEGEGL